MIIKSQRRLEKYLM